MKSRLIAICLATLCATAVWANNPGPVSPSWDHTWDFNSGTQGWTINGSGAFTAAGPHGSPCLYLPDGANATWDAAALNLGGLGGTSRFVLQADIYVGGTNYLQGSGIGAYRTSDHKGPWVTGTNQQGMAARDPWWSVSRSRNYGLSVGSWTTVQMDYGYTTPGYFWARYTATPGNGSAYVAGSWLELVGTDTQADIGPNVNIYQMLQIGGFVGSGVPTPWAQAYYDNVRLAIVPEPTTLIMLACGLLAIKRRHTGRTTGNPAICDPDPEGATP